MLTEKFININIKPALKKYQAEILSNSVGGNRNK